MGIQTFEEREVYAGFKYEGLLQTSVLDFATTIAPNHISFGSLSGSSYSGNDLPNDSYKTGTFYVNSRTNTSKVVFIVPDDTTYTPVYNVYTSSGWSGWKSLGSGGGGSIVVDSQLSTTSTNPVQNKVITSALNNKANISDIPTELSELTNDVGYITSISNTDVTNALGYVPYNSSNPDGYITGINSNDVTTALGYTPYSSANPNGYTSNTGTVTSVQVGATSPVQSSSSGAQTSTLNTTISLADEYGDIKNPYGVKPAGTVLASGATVKRSYDDVTLNSSATFVNRTLESTLPLSAGSYVFSADFSANTAAPQEGYVWVVYDSTQHNGNSVTGISSVKMNGTSSYAFTLTTGKNVNLGYYTTSNVQFQYVPVTISNIKLVTGAPEFRALTDDDIPKTNSYSATGTTAITGTGVAAALDTLDSSIAADAGMAIASIAITNGKISNSSKISVGETNQNAFSNVKVGNTTIAADSKTDTLEVAADSPVTLTPDATNDKITASLVDAYGDIKNPYGAKSAGQVLATGAPLYKYSNYIVAGSTSELDYTVAILTLPAGDYVFSADLYSPASANSYVVRNRYVVVEYGNNHYASMPTFNQYTIDEIDTTCACAFTLSAETSVTFKITGSNTSDFNVLPFTFSNIQINNGATTPSFRYLTSEDLPFKITNVLYATSTTNHDVRNKVAILSDASILSCTITTGTLLMVNFVQPNSVSNASLILKSNNGDVILGATYIRLASGGASSGLWDANHIINMVYDGSMWVILTGYQNNWVKQSVYTNSYDYDVLLSGYDSSETSSYSYIANRSPYLKFNPSTQILNVGGTITVGSAPSTDMQVATKKYVDDQVISAGSGTVTSITAGTGLQVGDGTGGDTITTSGTLNHTASGVTAGTYVPSASAKDNTLNLPSFTIDAQGHVTAASNYGYTMTTPTLSHATNSQTYNRTVGGLYYDEYGTIYYRTPFAVTPILNYGSGNDGKSPSSSGHGNPLGYSFFVLTAGQTSMTVKIYDSTYVLSNFGQGWNKFIVTDVVARDAVTKEPVILGWSATEGTDETDIYDDSFTKASTITITIEEAYANNIEFEILYHRIPAAVM